MASYSWIPIELEIYKLILISWIQIQNVKSTMKWGGDISVECANADKIAVLRLCSVNELYRFAFSSYTHTHELNEFSATVHFKTVFSLLSITKLKYTRVNF